MAKVSIIIPCYNDGKYLPEALASAKAQTYPDIEIIVVDDHSTDPATLGVFERLREEGVTVLKTPEGKKGPSAARNTGIAAASGKYLLPLDADDKIHPEYAAKAVAILDSRPDIGVCYCKAVLFGVKRGPWKLPPYSWEAMLAGNMVFATAFFRKVDWEILGGYDESICIGHEDYAFWIRLIALGREVERIEEVLFWYRVKPGSRTARKASIKLEMEALEEVFRSCESVLSQNSKLLFKEVHRLRKERGELQCLVSWKILRYIFSLEWRMRQIVKKILGRA